MKKDIFRQTLRHKHRQIHRLLPNLIHMGQKDEIIYIVKIVGIHIEAGTGTNIQINIQAQINICKHIQKWTYTKT